MHAVTQIAGMQLKRVNQLLFHHWKQFSIENEYDVGRCHFG
jgi:hypothetical protein